MTFPVFTIGGPPRTKKTSSRIVQIPAKGTRRSMSEDGAINFIYENIPDGCGQAQLAAAIRKAFERGFAAAKSGFPRLLPSEAHEEWFTRAMQQSPIIRQRLIRAGIDIPIRDRINVRALFFRDAERGDLTGYMQALADWLQEPQHKNGKTTRNGAGIIGNDSQIASWDGTRMLKDAAAPRIEVQISIVGKETQQTLFETEKKPAVEVAHESW